MSDDLLAGIDCGATKVMVQSGVYSSKTNKISPGPINQEFYYSDHPDWDSKFMPVPLDTQKSEYQSDNISLSYEEINQSNAIIDTIVSSIKIVEDHKIGLCYPGLKNHKGIVVMANGPRIPNLTHHIHPVKSILNDSDCCVIGELKSTIGMMQDTRNGIYIGGGTGIADGIILNGEILNLINTVGVPRCWEINVSSNETVETLLSPAGMIRKYNDQNNEKVKVLARTFTFSLFWSLYFLIIPAGDRRVSTVSFELTFISQHRGTPTVFIKFKISPFKIIPSAIPVPPPMYMPFLVSCIMPIVDFNSPITQQSESFKMLFTG